MWRLISHKDIGNGTTPNLAANNRENDAVNPKNYWNKGIIIGLKEPLDGKVFDEQLKTTPRMDNYSPVSAIRGLLDSQAAAICNRDIAAATANYAFDVLIFDVVGPLQQPKGNSTVRNRLQEWMGTFSGDAPVLFEITDPTIEASEDRGFSHSLNHVRASLGSGGILDMYWRETLGWQKINGEWKIVHAHSSVPFNPSTGMASTGLKPA